MSGEETVTGLISIRRVASGSKSEQVTAILSAGERSWLLRRRGGPTFGVDAQLVRYEGRRVTVTGFAGSGVFLVTGPIKPAD
jgi:hypothetical protein